MYVCKERERETEIVGTTQVRSVFFLVFYQRFVFSKMV